MNNIKRQLEAYNMINEHGNIKVIKGMIQALKETNGSVDMILELKQMLKEALNNDIEQRDTLNSNN
jgi:phosphoenolpyruvate-protein kinase (PTS system EI component)